LLKPKAEPPHAAPKPEVPPAKPDEAPAPKPTRRPTRSEDARRVLSYDEARALGLIGGDDAVDLPKEKP